MIEAVALGAAVGAVLGVLGGGGSVLAVPALVYGLGQPASQAVPTSLAVVGAAAAVGVLPRIRAGQVRWAVAAVFGAAGILASFAGAWVNHRLPEPVVLAGFALLMVVVGGRLLLGSTPETGRALASPRARTLALVAAGAVVGFLTGLFGVGGGFLVVPALVLVVGMPMHAAVGTSLVVIVINAAAGFVAHLGQASLDLQVVGTFAAGALGAALLAGRLGQRLDGRRLARAFGALVLAVAVAMLLAVLIVEPGIAG